MRKDDPFNKMLLKKVKEKTFGGNEVSEIFVGHLLTNPYQPRFNITKEDIEGLAQSIKEQGLLQPIVVRDNYNKTYTIIAGHRRIEAYKLLGEKMVKAIILKNINDSKLASYAITENFQREDLDIIENAIALKRYKEEFGKSFVDIAKELGMTKSTVIAAINILNLPEEILKDLKQEKKTIDVTSLNLINSLKNKLSVSMLTDEINNLQISLYEGLKSNNRSWLKSEIKQLLREKDNKKEKIINIKAGKKKAVFTLRLKGKEFDKTILEKIEKAIEDIVNQICERKNNA